jgi:hypothetical protein
MGSIGKQKTGRPVYLHELVYRRPKVRLTDRRTTSGWCLRTAERQ